MSSSNESSDAASIRTLSVAPRGSKPGAVMVETSAVCGKILAVDSQKHKVTVEDPDGKKKTIKVSKKLNIDGLKVGETVDAVLTESRVIDVVK